MARDRSTSVRFGIAAAMAVAIALVVLGWLFRWFEVAQFFRSYLVAWLFCFGISVGSLMLLLLHNLTGGAWGWRVRHILLASATALPLVGVAFFPIAFGLEHIYEWADEAHVVGNRALEHKAPYLNATWFYIRAGVYWLVWLVLLFFLRSTSRRVEYETDAARRIRVASGVGLAASGLAVTFASFDLGMSLEPEWFSTIYGVIFFAGHGLTALAFAIVALVCLDNTGPQTLAGFTDDLHDLGKLLLAFTMFWAYVSFSQFLIMWYGNIPEEVVWYQRRLSHGWEAVAIVIALFHFFVPFFILLGRTIKRLATPLASVAAWLLAMNWLHTLWLVEPAFEREGVYLPWLDLALTVGMGGLWLLYYTWIVAPVPVPADVLARNETVDLAHG